MLYDVTTTRALTFQRICWFITTVLSHYNAITTQKRWIFKKGLFTT